MQQKTFQQLPPPWARPHAGLIGHRGAAGLAPENTLESFRMAATHGIQWVEFDVQACASGEWMVFHDADLERTSNGQGFLQSHSLEYLQSLDAGTWFSAAYQGARIPSLEEALEACIQYNLYPMIEIKLFDTASPTALGDLLERVQSVWPPSAPPPLFSSFALEALMILRACNPAALIGYLVNDLSTANIALASMQAFTHLHCHYSSITKALLAEAASAQLPVLAYTLNDPRAIQSLLQQGVHAVFSDLTFLKESQQIENFT